MSFITQTWDKIKSQSAVLHPIVKIPTSRIVDSTFDYSKFEQNKNYFEIRLQEQFLKNSREYWNEYNPMTIFLSEFIFDKHVSSLPFIVGPDLLKSVEEIKSGNNIRYKNTRINGPTPYLGDQISIFCGLFKLKSNNWALNSLSILETVAKSFDNTKMSNFINISEPLVKGIETILGNNEDVQFSIGHKIDLSPTMTASKFDLTSGYWASIKTNSNSLNTDKLWIKEGRLFFGDNADNIIPYSDSDYLLFSLEKLLQRGDYTTFDFNKKWDEVHAAIWDGNKESAQSKFNELNYLIRKCKDLIPLQMGKLQTIYLQKLKDEYEAWKSSQNVFDFINNDNSSDDIFGMSTTKFSQVNMPQSIKNVFKDTSDSLKNIELRTMINKPDFNHNEKLLSNSLMNGTIIINDNILNNMDDFTLSASTMGLGATGMLG